jgi:hypothetical protein
LARLIVLPERLIIGNIDIIIFLDWKTLQRKVNILEKANKYLFHAAYWLVLAHAGETWN